MHLQVSVLRAPCPKGAAIFENSKQRGGVVHGGARRLRWWWGRWSYARCGRIGGQKGKAQTSMETLLNYAMIDDLNEDRFAGPGAWTSLSVGLRTAVMAFSTI